jgi:hypothetical protein
MLAYGAGVDENHVQAMWLELAWNGATSHLTRQLYTQQRDKLAQRMTVEQITDAKHLAGEWDAAPLDKLRTLATQGSLKTNSMLPRPGCWISGVSPL